MGAGASEGTSTVASRDPIETLRAASTAAVAGRRHLWSLPRRTPRAWLVLPVLVAGIDAARGLTPALILAVVSVAIVLPLARHGAADAVAPGPLVPPPGTWLAIVVALAAAVALLLLAGAPASAAVLALGVALVAAWATALPLVVARWPVAAPMLGGLDTLALPALVPCIAALVGAVLPAAGAVPGAGTVGGLDGVPWPWILVLAGWSLGTAAVGRAEGRRDIPLGRVAVLGYGVAALVAAGQGPSGALAAGALALELPVAASLFGPRAGRAPEERRILDRLVGPWLAVLLLVGWGVLTVDAWVVAVVGLTGVSGYVLASVLMLRSAGRRRRARGPVDPAGRDLSLLIVLPLVRDVPDLERVVLSLRAQTYADTRVAVVALPGVDVAAAEQWLGADAIETIDPPWDGRQAFAWARAYGLTAADADLALILDPATTLAPVAARVLVEHLVATRVAAVGATPRTALPRLGDRLAGAGPGLWRSGVEPRWWIALTRGRPARLVGPDPALVLLRIDALRATEQRRGAPVLVDDGLLRALADDGRRVGLVHASDVASRRADTSIRGMTRWWRHMATRVGGGTFADLAAMLIVLTVGLLGPVVLPAVAWLIGAPRETIVAGLIPLGMLLIARVVLAVTQRGSLRAIGWHPVTILVAVIGVGLAVVDHLGLGAPGRVGPRAVDEARERPVPSGT